MARKREKTPANDKKYSFFEDVFEVAKLIPRGRVTSYGAIAAYLGLRSSARMVGWAMNATHMDKKVPAHRVVNSQGLLTGKHHFVPPSAMEERLKKEGVKVVKDKVQDFQTKFWDPAKEL
ncbi:MAG TPA: MGMT family protein [Cyclobacteriaceae bacterium]|nr:MGMT family protein [Cyclobacteriaceae bacterium]